MTNIPETLYKYRSLRGDGANFARQIIVDHQIYFARVSSFNDPFDSVPPVALPTTRIGLERGLNRVMREVQSDLDRRSRKMMAAHLMRQSELQLQADLQAGIRQGNDDMGVYCLSARRDHVLMWSHYADSHAGLAVGFRASSGSPFHIARPVSYSKTRPQIRSFSRKNRAEAALEAMTTKADFWAYEEEWRLFNLPTLAPGVMKIASNLISEIILGPLMPKDQADQVKSWNDAREFPAKLLRATIDPYEFRLHVEAER